MNSLIAEPVVVLGAQQPRLSLVPEYVSSAGEEALEIAVVAGVELDPWERLVLVDSLGERPDGRWAAFEVAVVAPRQNGKGTIFEIRELAGLFSFGERLLIHSAHEQATSSEHFRRLLNLIEGVPEFDQRVLKVVRGKGSEAIELRGGQRIFFKTRTGGGGRGLTGDFVGLDEAMILPAATTAALVPTMAARSMAGNPQLMYAGSAVDEEKHQDGIVLARVRERALRGAARLAYFEWSAGGDDPAKDDPARVTEKERSDPERWAQANPGLGIRISLEHIENECNGALGPREFAVERLGIGAWPNTDENPNQTISDETWKRIVKESAPQDPVCFAFDVTPDRSSAAIGVAGRREDGLGHIEVIDHRRGTGWVAPRIAELVGAHKHVAVICDAAGPAAALLPDLDKLDVEVVPVSAKEHAQACGMIFDAIEQQGLRCWGEFQAALDAAVKGAAIRPLAEAWAWSRKNSSVDISPLVAVTLAWWGLETQDASTGGAWFAFA